MANVILMEKAAITSNTPGTAVNLDGSKKTISLQADGYGTGGKFVLKGNANVTGTDAGDSDYITISEYTANTILEMDRLPAGWKVRVDVEISSGTMTNALAVMGG